MDKFSKNIENIGYKFEQKISMSKKGWKKKSINDKRNNNTHTKIVLSSIYVYIYIYYNFVIIIIQCVLIRNMDFKSVSSILI